jgi:uncharacterized protein
MDVRLHDHMASVDRESWNHLARTLPTPLLTWEWLNHLETSGSIAPETGWQPLHMTFHDGDRMVGAVPLYLRDSSWGEFVFDFAFAELAEQLGKSYYPKLVGMSPASPVPAFGFLVDPERTGRTATETTTEMVETILSFCRSRDIPVLQFNFVLPRWVGPLQSLGMQAWQHHGFEWRNEGFSTFDDYLARFRKNQRRNIRRERQSMEDQNIDIQVIHGSDASEEVYRRMAEYYVRTNAMFGPYAARFLDTRFFTEMPEEVRRHVWFVAAYENDKHEREEMDDPVALAMLVRRGNHILGRYWGAREEIRDLHFNVCYYAPIEWAIREGISTFDPGMGSTHKVRRGFRSVPNWSLHYFFDADMQQILEANMDRINAYEAEQIAILDEEVPYKEFPEKK